jgi:hypothetical protein
LEPATVAAGLPGRLGRTAPGGKPARPAAIAWKPIDDRDPQGRRLLIRDSVFTGVHAALFLAGQPREVRVINCLGIEAGALIALGGTLQPSPLPQAVSGQLRRPPQAVSNQRRLPLQVVVQRVTLRESGPLLRFYPDDKAGPSGPVAIQADDCVFDIGVSATALLEVRTETPAGEWLDRVTIQGAGSLITPNANIASRIAPSDGGREVIDASKMELEGLMAAPFEFAGPPSHDPSTSVIVSAQAPRRSSQLPGVDTSSLRVPPLH